MPSNIVMLTFTFVYIIYQHTQRDIYFNPVIITAASSGRNAMLARCDFSNERTAIRISALYRVFALKLVLPSVGGRNRLRDGNVDLSVENVLQLLTHRL